MKDDSIKSYSPNNKSISPLKKDSPKNDEWSLKQKTLQNQLSDVQQECRFVNKHVLSIFSLSIYLSIYLFVYVYLY